MKHILNVIFNSVTEMTYGNINNAEEVKIILIMSPRSLSKKFYAWYLGKRFFLIFLKINFVAKFISCQLTDNLDIIKYLMSAFSGDFFECVQVSEKLLMVE